MNEDLIKAADEAIRRSKILLLTFTVPYKVNYLKLYESRN